MVFMQIESKADQVEDPRVRRICVVLNASPGEYMATFPEACQQLELHPQMSGLRHVEACTIDNSERTLNISPHTIIVLVESSFSG